jgi:hypothetical protein
MNIPICDMILMPIVHHIFLINVFKMEQAFHMEYKERDMAFYFLLENW